MQAIQGKLLCRSGIGLLSRARTRVQIIASQRNSRQDSYGTGGAARGGRGAGGSRGRGGGRQLAPRGGPRRRAPRDEDDSDADDADEEEDGFLVDDRLESSRLRRPGSLAPQRSSPTRDRQTQPPPPPASSTRGAAPVRLAPPPPAGRSASTGASRPDPDLDLPAPRGPQDPFDSMHERLMAQTKAGFTVRRESWEKLFGHVRSPRHARAALELMRADAGAREATDWDWATHGYGQTAFQLIQAASEAGAPELAELLLDSREELHLTLNKDLLPTLMRKVAAAMPQTADGGDGVDEQVEVVQRLYDKEVELRGGNSPEAAYELSRVLRRAGDVGGVRSLHAQVVREGLAVRAGLLDDLERWLAKRGVRL